MGEPVKKAVRKAVRARVKKLGMKNDSEVCCAVEVCRPPRRLQVYLSPSGSIASHIMTTTLACIWTPTTGQHLERLFFPLLLRIFLPILIV